MNHVPHLDIPPPTPSDRFERAMWEAKTAINDAKELLGDLFPPSQPDGVSTWALQCGMLLAMLQVAHATLTSVENLHRDVLTTKLRE